MNHLDTSPTGNAARQARIEAAVTASLLRAQKLSDARVLVRSAGIKTPDELLAAIENIVANTDFLYDTVLIEYRTKLLELATDLDAELKGDEPELPKHAIGKGLHFATIGAGDA